MRSALQLLQMINALRGVFRSMYLLFCISRVVFPFLYFVINIILQFNFPIYTLFMNARFIKDAFGWGFFLWLFGYILGIILFSIIPPAYIGWVIMPLGIVFTTWVLWYEVKGETYGYFVKVALVWTSIALLCDYLLLVQLFKPLDGYYKLDVYLYYILTFLLPLIIGWRKTH